jgi:hypothetical protein
MLGFYREQIKINVLKALASLISVCSLHVIEDYEKLFYMSGERDIPSIRFKMSL